MGEGRGTARTSFALGATTAQNMCDACLTTATTTLVTRTAMRSYSATVRLIWTRIFRNRYYSARVGGHVTRNPRPPIGQTRPIQSVRLVRQFSACPLNGSRQSVHVYENTISTPSWRDRWTFAFRHTTSPGK